MRQDLGYCTTQDGVRIAYAVSGQGPVLVRVGHWYTHLEHDWDLSGTSAFLREMEKRFRLVRYDVRGTGLSDRFPEHISVDSFVSDLATVVDALELDKFTLLGISQGGAVGALYALEHPERVSGLVLLNALARGAAFREGVGQGPEVVDAMRALIRQGWGSDDPAFRAMFTTQMMPGATQEQARRWNELERLSVAPDVAERIFAATQTQLNVTERVAGLRVPALVLHVREDHRIPFEEGRLLASRIPGARFVPLPGENHVLLPQDEGFPTAVREICEFAGVRYAGPLARASNALGGSLGRATRSIEASTWYKLIAIVGAVISIVSFIWTMR